MVGKEKSGKQEEAKFAMPEINISPVQCPQFDRRKYLADAQE